MGRVSKGQQHPRPCSGKRPLRSCRSNGNNGNVILIDVDSEIVSDNNVIILDTPEPRVLRKDKGVAFQNVIHIDDDEAPDNRESGAVGNDDGNHADASTSRNSYAAAEERQFGKENVTPVRLSKCKRTYSGKASKTNHYGFFTIESESDASDSDENLDCDLMEDTSGKFQEQWERAFFRRKNNLSNRDTGVGNKASTSHGTNWNHDQHVEAQGKTRDVKKGSFTSGTNKLGNQNGTSSSYIKEDAASLYSRLFVDPDIYDCSLDALLKDHLHAMNNNSQANDSTFINTKLDEHQDCEPGDSRRHMEESHKNPAVACNDGTIPVGEHPPKSAALSEDLHHVKGSSVKDEATMHKCQSSTQFRVDSAILNNDNAETSQSQAIGSTKESLNRSMSPNGKTNHTPSPANGSGESVSGAALSSEKTCIFNEREKLKETDEYKRAEAEEWASRQQALQRQAEEAQNMRRLRKRSKAESMRVSDMERRQKQRLEEIRDSKKKDEENMNLKEAIRAEIRKDLQKLESSCTDMAFLLHSLDISVSSWPFPSQQEVQAAYKKALMTFHPDRASRSDIRKQVEAEEKFKLVNRLKAKFSTPSLK